MPRKAYSSNRQDKNTIVVGNILSIKIGEGSKTRKNAFYQRKCTVWGVRGHIRHYKSGKTVLISPYKKGINKDTEEPKSKRYLLKPNLTSNNIVTQGDEKKMKTMDPGALIGKRDENDPTKIIRYEEPTEIYDKQWDKSWVLTNYDAEKRTFTAHRVDYDEYGTRKVRSGTETLGFEEVEKCYSYFEKVKLEEPSFINEEKDEIEYDDIDAVINAAKDEIEESRDDETSIGKEIDTVDEKDILDR